MIHRTQDDYYVESKRLRREVLQMEIFTNPMLLLTSIHLTWGEANYRNKELRLNKSLADSNGALVLGGASYPILIGRLPIQTGLLPYIVSLLRCKYTNYI